MKNIDYRKYLPYLVAVLTFVALTLAYFKPITEGYELVQGDVTKYQGMAKEIHDFRRIYGTDPLWTNSMFGGMPAYQIDVQNSSVVLATIDSVLMLTFPGVIGYFFLLFIGFYILMLCLKVDPWLAIAGAVAYAFSTYFILVVGAGHNTKVHALAYMPAALGGFFLLMRGRMWLGASVFTLFMSLELLSNHVQITYYLILLMFAIGITELISVFVDKKDKKDFFMRSGLLVFGALLALMANSGNLWNTYEYGKDTTRGTSELVMDGDGRLKEKETGLDVEYMTRWSYGIDETWNLLIPNAKGGGSGYIGGNEDWPKTKAVSGKVKALVNELAMQNYQSGGREGFTVNSYWGNQPGTGGPTYIGAFIVFLFVLSFVFVKDRMKWGVLALCVLAIMLSWGHNYLGLTEFFAAHFPGYNKFRSVTMILSIVQLAAPMMGFLFLKELVDNQTEFLKKKKQFLIASGAVIGFILLLTLMPKAFISFESAADANFYASLDASISGDVEDEITAFRVSVFRGDALRSLAFIIVGFIFMYLFIVNNIKRNIMFAGIGLVIVLDLYLVDLRFLNNDKNPKGQYNAWQKRGDYPYMPTQGDMDIFRMESEKNPELMKKVEEEISNLPEKTGKDAKKNEQLDQIVNAVFPVLNFNTNYRVLELGDPFNSSTVSYFHKSVGGYHGAKMKKYQELIEFAIGREHNMLYGTFMQMAQSGQVPVEQIPMVLPMTGIYKQTHVLNMMNTRYVLLNPGLPAAVNPDAAGAAWFAKNIRFVDNAQDEILAVANLVVKDTIEVTDTIQGKIETYRKCEFDRTDVNIVDSVVVDKMYADQIKNKNLVVDSAAYIQVKSYLPNEIIYESKNSAPGFAVFSEIYYNRGWKASINGNEVDFVRVNYVLRGLDVPAGTNTIEFRFQPDSYYSMRKVNIAGNILVLLAVCGFAYLEFRKSRKAITKS